MANPQGDGVVEVQIRVDAKAGSGMELQRRANIRQRGPDAAAVEGVNDGQNPARDRGGKQHDHGVAWPEQRSQRCRQFHVTGSHGAHDIEKIPPASPGF